MTLVLDSGALIAIEHGDRAMWRRLKTALASDTVPVSHGAVLGQAWRGGSRQARLAKTLPGIDIRPVDEALGRAAGELLASARLADVVDAALVLLARDGDAILTSDPDDIEALARASGRHVDVIRV